MTEITFTGDPGFAEEEEVETIFDKLLEFFDQIRLASLIAVAGILGALFALVTGQVSFEVFLASLAGIPAGSGVLGMARNGAGHGVGRKLKIGGMVGQVGVRRIGK